MDKKMSLHDLDILLKASLKPRTVKVKVMKTPPSEAKQDRDEGIIQALSNGMEWTAKAQRMLADAVPSGWIGLFEEARMIAVEKGLEQPHTYHCWGAISRALISRGVFVHTDELASPRDRKSHASRKLKVQRA